MIPSATAFFVICYCVLAVYSIDEAGSRKVKRDVSGLVSFPRIGRLDQSLKGPLRQEGFKRQSLISFPRTGKRNMAAVADDFDADGYFFASPRIPDKIPGNNWAFVQVKDLRVLPARLVKDIFGRDLIEGEDEIPSLRDRRA